jgi:hypothetical protein
MTKIKVDTDQIEDAADVFGTQVAEGVFNAASTLAFAASGGMAGNDDAGNTWSASYDQAAKTVMGVTADVVNGSYKLASMLLLTGDNHKRADELSRMNHTGVPPQYLPKTYTNSSVEPFTLPASGGAGADTPTGWSIVEHAVGYAWPGGHQDKLRATAKAWNTAADAIVEAGTPILGATAELLVQNSPEMDNAGVVARSMGTHLNELAAAYRSLGGACENYASYLDTAHNDAKGELVSFLEWSAGIEFVGGVASFFSFGTAEVPTQAAEAGRIAATAARIAEIIRTLIAAARTVTEAISTAITRVVDVSKGLKGLLGARLSRATADLVEALPNTAKTAEELAETGLTTAADTASADDALFQKYLARKKAEGKNPISRDAWQNKIDSLRTNKAVGDGYRDQVMNDLGITDGEAGWSKEVTVKGSGRRLDFANVVDREGYEVKSGSTPTAEGLTQMAKDESLVRDNWTITWQLKSDLNPTLMARLQELAAKYPGRFNYTVSGG